MFFWMNASSPNHLVRLSQYRKPPASHLVDIIRSLSTVHYLEELPIFIFGYLGYLEYQYRIALTFQSLRLKITLSVLYDHVMIVTLAVSSKSTLSL